MSESLYARINAIKADAIHIPKKGYNQRFNFNFTQADDVMDGLRELFAKHGVCVAYKGVVEHHQEVVGQTSGGNNNYRHTVKLAYDIVNVDNPEERFEAFGLGEAYDTQDKGHNKAITNGHKYFYMKLFDITEGDPEGDPDANRVEKPAEKSTPASKKKTAKRTTKKAASKPVVLVGDAAPGILDKMRERGVLLRNARDFLGGAKIPAVKNNPFDLASWPIEVIQALDEWLDDIDVKPEPEIDGSADSWAMWSEWKITREWDTQLMELTASDPGWWKSETAKAYPKSPSNMYQALLKHQRYQGMKDEEVVNAVFKDIKAGSVVYPTGDVIPF